MASTSQGLTFVFNATTFSVTNVSVSDNQDLLDGTDLSVAPNGNRIYVNGLASEKEVQIEYFGGVLASGTSGSLAITGPIGFSGVATVSQATISASVGDLVRGSATFRVV